MSDEPTTTHQAEENIPNTLGVNTNDLADLKIDEILHNKQAIQMLLHNYKQLNKENNELKTQINTNQSYVQGYNSLKKNSQFGGVLLLLGNIFIGFGTNILTTNVSLQGGLMLIAGFIMDGFGFYFSFIKNE